MASTHAIIAASVFMATVLPAVLVPGFSVYGTHLLWLYSLCFRDILTCCPPNLTDHTEVSLCSRPQRPGLDTSVQSTRVGAQTFLPSSVGLSFIYPYNTIFFCSVSLFRAMSVWDTCLQITVACTLIGAWVGAFPIPLDWDRPWQVISLHRKTSFNPNCADFTFSLCTLHVFSDVY
ncbi:hypothetical protein XENOCAPTIV_022424 [Xenoophorus captivus]|uniref:Phosphatidylinositol glycan anchor biosynthesis class F n=1 Tax=Xenoophorus captivus TaxID=1517983 RepID=A0ABV0R1N5_9TELE